MAAGDGAVVVALQDEHLLIRIVVVVDRRFFGVDELPAGGQATPMTYEADGRQFLVIMAGGHHFMATPVGDYFMEEGDFDPPKAIVEPYRHGVKLGSNYLYLDMHVSTVPPLEAKEAVDPKTLFAVAITIWFAVTEPVNVPLPHVVDAKFCPSETTQFPFVPAVDG